MLNGLAGNKAIVHNIGFFRRTQLLTGFDRVTAQRKYKISFGKIIEIVFKRYLALKTKDIRQSLRPVEASKIIHQERSEIAYLLGKTHFITLDNIFKKNSVKKHVEITRGSSSFTTTSG